MLTTILNNLPAPKFIIIQDSLVLPGSDILLSVVKSHIDIKRCGVHFFCFENNPEKIRSKFISDNFYVYDFLTDIRGWLSNSNLESFEKFIETNNIQGVIIIDSLSNFILEYGLVNSYKILNKLCFKSNIIQISTVLHSDTLEEIQSVLKYFEHISTLNLKLELVGNSTRVKYRHRKTGGKLVKKVEEFYFEDNIFRTRDLAKIDAVRLLGPSQPETSPENLSTFKISLDENEKKSRDGLTLPYMTKTSANSGQPGGSVIYNLDDEDDWDDEDPDDDLDI